MENCSFQISFDQLPVFEYALLETACPFVLFVYGCFHTTMTELSSCNRDLHAQSKLFSIWPVRGSLLTLGLYECECHLYSFGPCNNVWYRDVSEWMNACMNEWSKDYIGCHLSIDIGFIFDRSCRIFASFETIYLSHCYLSLEAFKICVS